MIDADQRKIIDDLKEHYAAYPEGMQPTFYASKVAEGWARDLVQQAIREIQQEEQQRLLGRGNAPVKAASR